MLTERRRCGLLLFRADQARTRRSAPTTGRHGRSPTIRIGPARLPDTYRIAMRLDGRTFQGLHDATAPDGLKTQLMLHHNEFHFS